MNEPSETTNSKTPKQSWFFENNGQQIGPISTSELKDFVRKGLVLPSTLIRNAETGVEVEARKLKGLFPKTASPPPIPQADSAQSFPKDVASKTRTFFAESATAMWSEACWDGINPFTKNRMIALLAEPTAWAIAIMGIAPLVIGTLNDETHQLFCMALYFAGLWAVVFTKFIVKPQKNNWPVWIGAMFFTGLGGIAVLLFIYGMLPTSLVNSPYSQSAMIRLIGSVFFTGLTEEFCKLVPVILYILVLRGKFVPLNAIMIGVFSGLGFAAFENIIFADRAVVESFRSTIDYGPEGLQQGVRSAMVMAMLRSISLVFSHALSTGIAAYFCTIPIAKLWHRAAYIAGGVFLSSILHGSYNWLQTIQPTFSCIVIIVSFMLFHSCVAYLREKSHIHADSGDTSESTN